MRAFLILCGLLGAYLGLYAWNHSIKILEHEQAEPVTYEFSPIRKEFKLDNGTPCVMVWAPRRAQSAGISCDWDYNHRYHVN